MAHCTYCDSFILFGGTRDQSGLYCNQKCQQSGYLMQVSQHIPRDVMDDLIDQVHKGACPSCGQEGRTVDVHKAHKVWSALVLTSWSSSPQISCKSCAVKRQLGATLFSGVLGWWGFPWGLIMTPFQVIRNITEMAGGPSPLAPSPLLRKVVQMRAAQMGLAAARAEPPPIPGAPAEVPPESEGRYQSPGLN
jgi:hypothetical protein